MKPVILEQAIAESVRRLRQLEGWSQDELARYARNRFGLTWTQSVIAAIEAGNRQLSVSEFLVLSFLFGVDLREVLPTAGNVALAPALLIDASALRGEINADLSQIALSAISSNDTRALQDGLAKMHALKTILDRVSPKVRRPKARDLRDIAEASLRSAERQAAGRLGIEPETLACTAFCIWGRGLTEERELRMVDLQLAQDTSPRSVQAKRGFVTRELLEEIRNKLVEIGEIKSIASRANSKRAR